jgi:hypothetical protein
MLRPYEPTGHFSMSDSVPLSTPTAAYSNMLASPVFGLSVDPGYAVSGPRFAGQDLPERAQEALTALVMGWNTASDAERRSLASAVRRHRIDRVPDGFGVGLLGSIALWALFPAPREIGHRCLNSTGVPRLDLPPSLQRIGDWFLNDTKEARAALVEMRRTQGGEEQPPASHAPQSQQQLSSQQAANRFGPLRSLDSLARCTDLVSVGGGFCRGASLRSIAFPPSLTSVGPGFLAHVVPPSKTRDVHPLLIDLSHCLGLSEIGPGFAEGCAAAAVGLPPALKAIPADCCVDMLFLQIIALGVMPRLASAPTDPAPPSTASGVQLPPPPPPPPAEGTDAASDAAAAAAAVITRSGSDLV